MTPKNLNPIIIEFKNMPLLETLNAENNDQTEDTESLLHNDYLWKNIKSRFKKLDIVTIITLISSIIILVIILSILGGAIKYGSQVETTLNNVNVLSTNAEHMISKFDKVSDVVDKFKDVDIDDWDESLRDVDKIYIQTRAYGSDITRIEGYLTGIQSQMGLYKTDIEEMKEALEEILKIAKKIPTLGDGSNIDLADLLKLLSGNQNNNQS